MYNLYFFNSLVTQHADKKGYIYGYNPCRSFSLGQPRGCFEDVAESCMDYYSKLGGIGNHFNSNNRPRLTCPMQAKTKNSSINRECIQISRF